MCPRLSYVDSRNEDEFYVNIGFVSWTSPKRWNKSNKIVEEFEERINTPG